MKLMIASDIHGSAKFALDMIGSLEREGADRLLLLGDLLYHGARNDLPEGYDTKAVYALLNGLSDRIIAVRGNCDSEVDQMVLDFPMMADYAMIDVGGQMVFATHGHVFSPAQPPVMAAGTLFLSGHTHVPGCIKQGNCWFANPGSVSLPKEGSERGYLVLEGKALLHRALDGRELGQWRL